MSFCIMCLNLQYIYNLLTEKITATINEEDNHFIERAIAEDDEVRQLWDDICRKLHSERGSKFLDNLDEKTAWLQVEAVCSLSRRMD